MLLTDRKKSDRDRRILSEEFQPMRRNSDKSNNLRNPQSQSQILSDDEKPMSSLRHLSEISFNEESYMRKFERENDPQESNIDFSSLPFGSDIGGKNDLEKLLTKQSGVFSEA